MVQEKQLRELFKYIESNWDVCVSQIDKTDIKRIFGGVLCEDIMNDTLHEVKADPEELKGNCSTFDGSRLVDQEYKPTDQVTDQATDQVQHAKPFDKKRFERLFCAVVASEPHYTYKDCMIETEKLLTQLDSFYFEKTSK